MGEPWGLPVQAVQDLGNRLHGYWKRFRGCFKTRTRDASPYAYHYLSGQLRMHGQRHFTGLGRETGVSGQNLQHFMSQSPWSGQAVCRQVRTELKTTEGLQSGGVLLIDESADKKAGTQSAGTARQYNGRLGKVDLSQVGVMLSYVNLKVAQGMWTWIDGALFLPEAWFADHHAHQRKRLGIPNELTFKSKPQLGWELIKRAKDEGVPFEAVGFDTLYGRNCTLRAQLRQARLVYLAEVPVDSRVYLEKPVLGVPQRHGRSGRKPRQVKVLSGERERVDRLRDRLDWQTLRLRATDRGELCDPFAARRVWTVYEGAVVEEWLVMRRQSDGKTSYALSNAPTETSLERLAWWKCQRYFIERSNQDAKSELGWDELQAQKHRAWEHHLALTVLASWFLAQTKYDWAQAYPRDPALLDHWQVDTLPALSVANLRELLRSVMPLKQLTVEQATERVIEHLTNRAYSRKSRLKKQRLIRESAEGIP